MGHDETAVIDERTTAEPTPPRTGRRRRQLAAAAAVAVVAVGAVAWGTLDGNSETAKRSDAAATAPSRGSAAASSSAPTATTVPPETETSHGGASAGTTPPAAAPGTAQPAPLPAGWEARTFQGVTFAVPPGAQAADVIDPGNADAPPSFVWTGPDLGDGTNAQISLWIYPADRAPALGAEYQSITVPGADQAHMRTGAMGSEPPLTAVDVHVLAGGRFINLVGMFAGGSAGEQMTRDLLATLRIG